MTTRQLILVIIAAGTIVGGVTMVYKRRQRTAIEYALIADQQRAQDDERKRLEERIRLLEQDQERQRRDAERADERQRDRVRQQLEDERDAGRARRDAGTSCRCEPGDPLCTCL